MGVIADNANKKRINRVVVYTYIFLFIPEFIASWIIAENSGENIFVVWFWIQLFFFAIWIVRYTFNSIAYHIALKKILTNGLYSGFAKCNYPNPTKYNIYEPEDYFVGIMYDDDLDIGLRLDAARSWGSLTPFMGQNNITMTRRQNKMLMAAIDKYHEINFSGVVHPNQSRSW